MDDYFLAGRHLGWVVVGASIFASNIGSEHLVGLAGSGATSGVALAHYELHAWCLLVLGWVMVPFYMRSGVYTMPEFLERRFSPAARWVLSLISLVAYVLTKMAVGIFAGGVVFGVAAARTRELHVGGVCRSTASGSDRSLVVVLTGLYTVLGGMRAVAYTEAVQTAVLVVGSLLLTVFGLTALGGWSELRARARIRRCSTCGSRSCRRASRARGRRSTKPGRMAWYFNADYPWPGMLFCAPIIGLWYWCTDQYIVQRTLGRQGRARGPPGHDLRRVPQAAAGVHLHRAGHDRGGARPQRADAAAGAARGGRRRAGRGAGAGGVSPDGAGT